MLSSCNVPVADADACWPPGTIGELDDAMLLPPELPLSRSVPEGVAVDPPPSFLPAEAILLVVVILTGTLNYEYNFGYVSICTKINMLYDS